MFPPFSSSADGGEHQSILSIGFDSDHYSGVLTSDVRLDLGVPA